MATSTTTQFDSYTDTFHQIRRKARERSFQDIRKTFDQHNHALTLTQQEELNRMWPLLLDHNVHWQTKINLLQDIVLEVKTRDHKMLLLHFISHLFHNLNFPHSLTSATNSNIFLHHLLHTQLTDKDLVRAHSLTHLGQGAERADWSHHSRPVL